MKTPSSRLLALLSLLLIIGCHARPPYEGKSAARLEAMLKDSSPSVKAQGAYGLSRLGPEARDAIPSLIEALKGDALVRENAALALGRIGPDAVDAVPALTAALRDSEWSVRRQAALALGEIGAKTASKELRRLERDPDRRVRRASREALDKIGGERARNDNSKASVKTPGP
jgi:HEAT repeat protein